MSWIEADENMAERVGLSHNEWKFLNDQLGRRPSETELQMIGVMWSEHCSYKSSKRFLKQLNTTGKVVLQGPGENAGLIDYDAKRAIAFKVESHNHPSYVEPFQGAATGVGGILRDIFTMGARPVAVGNYLRFGDLKNSKQAFLLDGVVSGIAFYGNCIGVPTLAGEVRTDDCYQGNILVNVFALGVVEKDKIFKAASAQPGALVMMWGAKTGRDGIHGASLLASSDFSESNSGDGQKIRVQVGDPFKEKCLMEATLDCMRELSADLIAIQDMGAAGLTCSTMEIAFKSNVGMLIELDKVPTREPEMKPFELLLSESQERMLAIVNPGSENRFKEILEKWNCSAEVIGRTIEGDCLKMTFEGDTVVDLPVQKVMDPPPIEALPARWVAPHFEIEFPKSFNEWDSLKALLALPSIASKRGIFERYDSTVGGATLLGPGHDAAVLWLGENNESFEGIAFKGICNEQWAAIDPQAAMELSMATSIRALASVGAKAQAYTDGINLGNPKEIQTLGALELSVQGMNQVAKVFGTPCISGNVSLYNQTSVDGKSQSIFPTIFAVVVGKIKDVRKVRPSVFQKAGNEVWLLEAMPPEPTAAPTGSAFLRLFGNRYSGLPVYDLEAEKKLQTALLLAHELEIFESIRTISEGGLAVAIAKSCFGANGSPGPFGFEGDFLKNQQRRDALLFAENGGRVLVEISPQKRADLMKLSFETKIAAKRLGTVTDNGIFEMKPILSGKVSELFEAWTKWFPEAKC